MYWLAVQERRQIAGQVIKILVFVPALVLLWRGDGALVLDVLAGISLGASGNQFWTPGFLFVVAALLLALVRAAWTLSLAATRALRAGAARAPTDEALPARALPWGWPDAALTGGLFLAALLWLRAFEGRVEPEGLAMGMDAPSYLSNVAAVIEQDWGSYNGDKRVLHPVVVARIAWMFDWDIVAASRGLSMVCAAALAPLTFLMGRPVFGRAIAAAAALLVLAQPQAWSSSVEVTNYALFYAMVCAAQAALVWACISRRWWTYAALGAASAAAFLTQEKAFLSLSGVGLALLYTLRRLSWRGWAGRWGLALAAALACFAATNIPVSLTAFGKLVSNQRAELHVEMPYEWETIQRPDLENPTPISRHLPDDWRGSQLEAALAAIIAPPDSDVVVFLSPERKPAFGARVGPGNARVRPHTSIPPTDYRWEQNLNALRRAFSTREPPGQSPTRIFMVQLGLMFVGLVALVVPLPGRPHRTHRVAALILAVSLLALPGPLSLKFHPRYLVQSFPVCFLLICVGADWLVSLAVGARRPGWRAVELLVAGGLVTAVGLGAMTDRSDAWLYTGTRLQEMMAYPHEDVLPTPARAGGLAVSRYLEASEQGAYDCTSFGVWFYRYTDGDLWLRGSAPECEGLIDADLAPGTLLIVSNTSEGGETYLEAGSLFRSSEWVQVFQFEVREGVLDPGDYGLQKDSVFIFERVISRDSSSEK